MLLFVTKRDVLEHVRSPGETLQRARCWLKPDSWLFLNSPNAGGRAAKLMGRRWVFCHNILALPGAPRSDCLAGKSCGRSKCISRWAR